MKYDSVLDQQSISGKIVSLILCVWKPCYMKSGHILSTHCTDFSISEDVYIDGVDYKYSSNRILFSSKRSYNMMRIDIVDDDVAEPPEEFVIKVTRIVTPGISLATGNSTKLLGIIDDNDGIV